ncbi:MAG: elongation factor G [Burkholderiales bacterium]|jgi:elongation factor G|nr:elongation factor G [Burkholderiales bacterium]
MTQYTTENIRTLALVGHGNAGKTTLAEAILVHTGIIQTAGAIEKGTTISDYDPLEKTFQHSLHASLLHVDYNKTRIHIVDTPGYPDFIGQAIGALDAVETAAVVINAAAGIEMITSRMMEWVKKRQLCRLIIINKIDAENIDLSALLTAVRETFGKECLPINLPADNGGRVVDCFFNPSGESDFMSVEEAHQALIDQVIEVDEDLMAKYLEQGEDIEPERLHESFERALREGHLIPICFTSAKNSVGIKELLDIAEKLLPNPTEGNPPPCYLGEGDNAEVFYPSQNVNDHALAHVFKIQIDPFVGKVSSFRVHQGTIKKDSQLYVGDGRKPFKVGHLFLMQGGKFVETDSVVPGDLAAVSKIEEISFGSVLHDSHDEDRIHMKPSEFPAPMHGVAVSPTKRGDEQRLSEILNKMIAEDPTLTLEHDVTLNETVLRGLGDLHLRSVLERMSSVYKLDIETRPPRVPFRETIAAKAEGHHRHKKQSGGAGQFGEVFLRIEPLPRGGGFEFVDEVKGGTIPTQFIPAVKKGIEQVLTSGPTAGFPFQDVRVIVYDGKHHAVDSKEIAFITAGRKAFLNAIEKAKPTILEPIVKLQINSPADNMGDITGDLSSRRGQVTGTQTLRSGGLTIEGIAPLTELEGYSARIKAITSGHGSWTMTLSHYEPAPHTLQQKLAEEYQKNRKQEED